MDENPFCSPFFTEKLQFFWPGWHICSLYNNSVSVLKYSENEYGNPMKYL